MLYASTFEGDAVWSHKYNKTLPKEKKLDEEDIKFYRKRIIQTTKNYLRLNRINSEVDSAFENYAEQLIKHFQFIDKKDMVQKEYENLPKKKNKKISKFELMDQNTLIMKTKENATKTIKDYLPIVVKEKKKKRIIIPKQKFYDIKNPELRKKGLKKEKSK